MFWFEVIFFVDLRVWLNSFEMHPFFVSVFLHQRLFCHVIEFLEIQKNYEFLEFSGCVWKSTIFMCGEVLKFHVNYYFFLTVCELWETWKIKILALKTLNATQKLSTLHMMIFSPINYQKHIIEINTKWPIDCYKARSPPNSNKRLFLRFGPIRMTSHGRNLFQLLRHFNWYLQVLLLDYKFWF